MKIFAKQKLTGNIYPVIALNFDNYTLELKTVVIRQSIINTTVYFQEFQAKDLELQVETDE